MSIIVWDGKMLAADKRATNNGHAATTSKIFRIDGMLIGFSGDACFGLAMLAWLKEGADPKQFPESQKSSDDYAGVVRIERSGLILKYERSPFPMPIHDRAFAMGSGRDYALAALHLGKGAREAVEVACALDIYCGNGIDTLEFE